MAPPINYALSYPHVGFTGLVHIRIPTFMALIEDLCLSFATSGFKRIVFLNGHYDNTYAIAYACANAADKLPEGREGVSGELLGRDDRRRKSPSSSALKNGLHANQAETSAVLAINPDLVDMDKRQRRVPAVPGVHVNTGAVHTAFFFTSPGSVYLGDQVRHVGRCPRRPRRDRRALPRGRRAFDARRARQHRTRFAAMPER